MVAPDQVKYETSVLSSKTLISSEYSQLYARILLLCLS